MSPRRRGSSQWQKIIMLVAIISDIHNNEVNLRKVLDYCKAQEIDTIICCGDLASQEKRRDIETPIFMATMENLP